jgi:hypothetical protein
MSEDPGTESVAGAKPKYDEVQLQYALDQLRSEQNLALGTAAGLTGALVGACIWALITVVTEFQIGWLAVAVGFLVGIAVRTFGKGIDKVFGFVGAVLALLGCLAGNVLALCAMIATDQDLGFFEVLSRLDLKIIQELMAATFSPVDLLFYAIALYEGYKLSFRRVTEQDIEAKIRGQGVFG